MAAEKRVLFLTTALPLKEKIGMVTLAGIFIDYLFIRYYDIKSISNDVYLLEADVYLISITTGIAFPVLTQLPFLFIWRRTIYNLLIYKVFVVFFSFFFFFFCKSFGRSCLRK